MNTNLNLRQGASLTLASFGITLALAATARAQTNLDVTLNFDTSASGALANSVAPSGVSFAPAVYAPDVNGDGDPISGTDAWRVDTTAPAITIQNTFNYNGFAAPSGANALDGQFSPVLISLDPTRYRGWSRVSFTLDNDPFGQTLPVDFCNALGIIVQSVTINQITAGLQFDVVPQAGLQKLTLPAGAFYDNLRLRAVAVPEPGTLALFVFGILPLAAGVIARRKR